MKPELNPLLLRQLRKHWGSMDDIPTQLWPLLGAVSESYHHYEEDRKLVDRAMALSSQELLENNQDLQRKNEMLDAFVYRVGHDLKSPIHNLLALTQMLQELQPEETKGSIMFQKTIYNIVQTAERMNVRVADLLDLSRMELSLDAMQEELDVEAMLKVVQEELQSDIHKNNAVVEYDFSALPKLLSGRENLHSLMSNLLSNGIKYRSPDRDPVIRLETYHEDGYDVLKITDNGLGMDLEKNRQKLFGMFNRFHSHVPGTGVGLFIIKKIMDKVGGKINVESTVGVGTTFYVHYRHEMAVPKTSVVDVAG
jgi:signal transduction histidine kinase